MRKEMNTVHSKKGRQEEGTNSMDASKLASGGELHQIAGGGHPVLTTNQGVPLSDNQNSLRANPRGPKPAGGFHSAAITETGEKGRIRPESFADHYSQARQFYLSQTPYEQAHIASALVFELSKVEHVHVRKAMVGHLRHIGEDLAKRVAAGLAFDGMPDAPAAAVPVQEREPSPALQIIGKMKDTLTGRAIGILIADGSDGAKLADGSKLAADGQLAGTPSVLFDAVAVILSDEGAKALSMESAAIDFVRDAFGHLKAIATDKGGRALLKTAGVGQDAGVVDVIDDIAFITASKTRQWAREKTVRTLA